MNLLPQVAMFKDKCRAQGLMTPHGCLQRLLQSIGAQLAMNKQCNRHMIDRLGGSLLMQVDAALRRSEGNSVPGVPLGDRYLGL